MARRIAFSCPVRRRSRSHVVLTVSGPPSAGPTSGLLAIELGAGADRRPRDRRPAQPRRLGAASRARDRLLGRRRRAAAAPSTRQAPSLYLGMFALALRRARACCCATASRPFPAWLTIDGLARRAHARRDSPRRRLRAGPRRDPGRRRRRRHGARQPRLRPAAAGRRARRASPPPPGAPAARGGCSARGLACCALADAIYVCQESRGTYEPARGSTRCGCCARRSIALAAWQRTAAPTRAHVGWAMAAVPLVLLGGLDRTLLARRPARTAARSRVVLAAAALFAGAGPRAMLMLAENFAAAAPRPPRGARPTS